MGLSQTTWNPASRAAAATGKCVLLGVTMETKSILASLGRAASISSISW